MSISGDIAVESVRSKPRRAPTEPSVYILAAAVVLAILLLFVAFPILQWCVQPLPRDPRLDFRLSLGEMLQRGAMNGFTLVWFFAVGASFGSFMNVVVWRMPRRMNFVSQSSICPNCRHAIRGRDNLPVLGWILLGGRCRDCGEPIAFRYPLVEIAFGGAAFFLCAVELANGGWNLPFHSGHGRSGFFETLWTPQWELILVMAFHFLLYIWLLTICLFEIDDEAAPRRFAIVALLLVLLNVYACPILHPVSWELAETARARPFPLAPVRFNALVGLLVGLLAALPAALLSRNARSYAINEILAAALIGAHLGWHAALSVLVISQLLRAAVSAFFDRTIGRTSTIYLVLAVTLQMTFWRWLHAAQWQSGALVSTLWLIFAGLAIGVLPALSITRRGLLRT